MLLDPASPLARLFAAPMRPGVVRWIGLRPARRAPMLAVERCRLDEDAGLLGDRYQGRPGGIRQVTLIAAEQIAAIGSYLDAEATPEQLRRNFVVSGVNLAALKGCRFRIGTAILEATGECHSCSRREETLGRGGYNAVRGHGGITARVVSDGVACVGDALERLA